MHLSAVFSVRVTRVSAWTGAMAAVLSLLPVTPAWSLPAFARATGVPCSACHTHAFGPELTPFGRSFKLRGYSMKTNPTIPISLDAIASYTHTAEDQPQPPRFSNNNNFAFDDFSGYFAGRIAEHLGAIAQVTYDGIARHTSWGILDVRYARDVPIGKTNTLFGVSVNNFPTLQDPWNSLYAWQSHFPATRLNNQPSESPQIYGFYATQVLGATFYAMVHDTLYLEVGGYQRLADRLQKDVGIPNPSAEHGLDGTAPYWRAALQRSFGSHYASIGMMGFQPHAQSPQERRVGADDDYTDTAFDATYQFANGGPHTFNVNASYIQEHQRLFATAALGGSSKVDGHLNVFTIDGQYAFRQTYSVTLAYFNSTGDADPIRFRPTPWFGSANHIPDSRYYTAQFEVVPFGKPSSLARPYLNMRFGLRYTSYLRFNGGSANYDGFGHSARDNDTVFLYMWMAI